MATIHVDVVSAEESIFSGEANFVALPEQAFYMVGTIDEAIEKAKGMQ